jgi:chemotaxis protein methyltransferase CheR
MREFTLSASLFGLLSGLVEERTGLHYEPEDTVLFERKVASRALEAGFTTPIDYYYFLRYDDADRREFDSLVETLVVNETYFFRETEQLCALCDTFVVPQIARGERPRIWCAAASTGEEPLTLAMMLADRGVLEKVTLIASDISGAALAHAHARVYARRSLRVLKDDQAARWLERVGDTVVVDRALHDAIDWRRLNLLDDAAIGALGVFDAILCRNVLIYFDDDTVRRVTTSLARALAPGGRLLVGASESLFRFGTLLECEERGGSFFYHRAVA